MVLQHIRPQASATGRIERSVIARSVSDEAIRRSRCEGEARGNLTWGRMGDCHARLRLARNDSSM